MSYTLDIWEPDAGEPPPADLRSILATIKRLRGEQGIPSLRFNQLVRTLTRRFPDIGSEEASVLDDLDLAWSDGPLLTDDSRAVLVIGLSSQRLQEVRPFVIESANALGLAVFDTQAGEAFFPGGVRLPEGRTVPAMAGDKSEQGDLVPPCREVGAAVSKCLAELFEPLGFKAGKGSPKFKRALRGGWQAVQVIMDDEWPVACQFSLLTTIRFDAASDLCVRLVLEELAPKDAASWPTAILRQREWLQAKASFIENSDQDYRVTSRAGLSDVLTHLKDQCISVLLPVLEQAKTLEGLDSAMNTSPLTHSPFFHDYDACYMNIVVGYLTRNSQLQQLTEEVLLNTRGKAPRLRAQTCADYVFSHPLRESAAT